MQHYGYWIDLQGKTFAEGEPTWIQAFPYGKYQHPLYGEIDFNADRANRMAQNVKTKVRGQDLDIDYDHKQFDGTASGWVRDAEARSDGLWLAVEWTKKAASLLKDKAYRYFSPEYQDEWEDNQGQKHKDVLLGGALTNRPFLKNILPINLSELMADDVQEQDTGGNVDPKKLRLALGLAEDATDEQVNTKLEEMAKPPEKKDEPTPSTLSEAQLAQVKELGEKNPAIAALLASTTQLSSKVGMLEAANRLMEVNVKLSEIDNDKRALSPDAAAKLREAVVNAPKALGDKVLDVVKEIVDKGIVDLTEHGKTNTDGNSNTATTQYLTEIDKYMAAHKDADYATAAEAVARENPSLLTEYRQEAYLKEND